MDCVKPTTCWRCGTVRCKLDGAISPHLVFSFREARDYFAQRYGALAWQMLQDAEMSVPCGKCANCRARKRKLQSVRLIHERSLYENACFVTLTYDEHNVPTTDTLQVDNPRKRYSRGSDYPVKTLFPEDLTKFLKRLRRRLSYTCVRKKDGRDHVERIRYFAVGEYGGHTGRPHYHLIIFNWFPSDAKQFRGHDFISRQIAELWPFGYHLVSSVTDGACRYCAQYVTKKLVKSSSPLDACRVPEFVRQSTKNGGIGVPWFVRNAPYCSSVGYCTYRSKGVVYRSSLPPSYVRAMRKYFRPLWEDWRARAIASVRSCPKLSDEAIRARERSNVAFFEHTLKGGVL